MDSTARRTGSIVAGLAVGSVALTSPADATVQNSWVSWTPPSSYGSSADFSGWDYRYATEATGVMTLPDSTVVYAKITGEIVDPTRNGTVNPLVGNYRGPSGVGANGTTTSDYWTVLPNTNSGNVFYSANVGSLPTNGDHIGLVGSGTTSQTVEFFSDAGLTQPTTVSNIVMLVVSLGGGTSATWSFNQDFDILSDNSGLGGAASGMTKGQVGSDYTLTAGGGNTEGAGAIQFTGTFSSFTWSVSTPELWAAWNLGASSLSPVAVPGGAGLASLAVGALGLRGRRRSRSA